MLRYGGRFENYFSRRSVTHIICSNLPDSKVKNLRLVSFSVSYKLPCSFIEKRFLFSFSNQGIQQRVTCSETLMDSGLYLCQQTFGM